MALPLCRVTNTHTEPKAVEAKRAVQCWERRKGRDTEVGAWRVSACHARGGVSALGGMYQKEGLL